MPASRRPWLPAILLAFVSLLSAGCQSPGVEKTAASPRDSDTIAATPHDTASAAPATEKIFLDTTWNGQPLQIVWRNAGEGKTDSLCIRYAGAKPTGWPVPEADNVADEEQRRLLVYEKGKTKRTAFVSLSSSAFLVCATTAGMSRPELTGVRLRNGGLELFGDKGPGIAVATLSGQVNYLFIDPAKRIALVHESSTETETDKGIESGRTIFIYAVTDSAFIRQANREFSLSRREAGPAYDKLYPEDDARACSDFYLIAYRKLSKK